MKCKIQWADAHGNLTPDDNEAIGLAVTWTEYEGTGAQSPRAYPICAEHAKQLKERTPYKPGTIYALVTHWRLVRF